MTAEEVEISRSPAVIDRRYRWVVIGHSRRYVKKPARTTEFYLQRGNCRCCYIRMASRALIESCNREGLMASKREDQPTTKAPRSVLSKQAMQELDAYWRAANYLSVGQIYLYDNPLLRKPLSKEHVKPRLLGHWGTTP